MKYEGLSVRDFLDGVKSGSIKLDDFYSKLFYMLKDINSEYNVFVTMAKPPSEFSTKGALPTLPVSVKDCICTKGLQSTAGSRILEGYIPPFDAIVISRIKEQGAVVIGKTNQDEFGFGTFSVNSGFGIPKNPIDPSRVSGGSSGGAAALTAALDYPHIALSESTGGSISCPAAWCGVAGLTPTYGLVSRYGLIDYANSLDKIGLIGKSVEDISIALSVIAGHDPMDSTSLQQKPQDYAQNLKPIKKPRIGIPKQYFESLDPEVEKAVRAAIDKSGFDCHEISLPMTENAISAYYIIACCEASTNLAKYCGMRYGQSLELEGSFNEYFSKVRTKYLGQEAKRRILLGTFARMAGYRDQYYLKALQVRALIIKEFRQAFKKFDALLAPTMPIIAPKFSEISKLTPIQHYMTDILTVGPNLAGIPHLSIPCGKAKGMPVGLHILGDHLQEGKVLQIGWNLERMLK